MIATKKIRVWPNIITRIYRNLEGKGKLNVQVGQEVIPSDILGSSEISSGFRILNLAQLLSVRAKDIQKYLKVGVGERIYKGELLAFKESNFLSPRKIVTAPSDSVIDFINLKNGEIRMSILQRKIDLPAGVYGIVEQINDQKSQVIIRCEVSKVLGVFGTGRMREGILHILGKRESLLVKEQILPELSGKIIVGGSLVYKDAVSAAISAGVSGIIVGGINAKDYKEMAGGRITFPKRLEADIGISIVVCEGFGSIQIGDDIYKILSTFDGMFVTIDGNAAEINLPSHNKDSILMVKNSHLPPLNEMGLLQNEQEGKLVELTKGMQVRVIGSSYTGEQGNILSLDKIETLLPSKIKTTMVILETGRRKIKVPLQNIEVLY